MSQAKLNHGKKSFANLGMVICLQDEVPIVGKWVRVSGYASDILVGSIIIVPIFSRDQHTKGAPKAAAKRS